MSWFRTVASRRASQKRGPSCSPRIRFVLAVLVCAFCAVPAAADEQTRPPAPEPQESPTGLPAVRGLEFQFHLDATWGSFGFANSLYKNAKPDQPVEGSLDDNWFEGAVKPGLSATYTAASSWQVYGKISAGGERTYGAPQPPQLVGGSASSFQL